MNTNTDASLPYVNDSVNAVVVPSPEKNSDVIEPPESWLPR
jgi:hypothetical protein